MDGVFISYARDGVAVARQLTASLTQEGVTSWLDIAEISAGATWASYLDEAMAHADVFVILISRSYLRSERASVELASAVARSSSDPRKRIIPVLIDPDLSDRDIPALLSRYVWVDLRDPERREEELHKLVTALAVTTPAEPDTKDLTAEEALLTWRREVLESERSSHLAQELQSRQSFLQVWVAILVATTAVGLLVFIFTSGSVSATAIAALAGAIASTLSHILGRRWRRNG